VSARRTRTRRAPVTVRATVDLDVEDHGSIVLLRPQSGAGTDWLAETCDVPSWAWVGGAIAVEPRMVDAIVHGARDAGLAVRGVT